jgi:hypothetical protein
MIKKPIVPVQSDPALADRFCAQMNTHLLTELTWLDNAYGKAYRRHRIIGEELFTYPAIFAGDDYESMMPDERHENFVWWDFTKPYRIISDAQNIAWRIETEASAVFFVDLSTIYPSADYHTGEALKSAIAAAFSGANTDGMISFDEISENWEEVYPGYSLPEGGYAYLMHPFYAVRFTGTVIMYSQCQT